MKPKYANELDFCPLLRDMLISGRTSLSNGEQIAISGTSTLNNIRALRHALKSEKYLKTLEVGLAYGASALTLLATHAELNQSGSKHIAIDPYQSTTWRSAGLTAIRNAGLTDNFTLIEQDSAVALPRLYSEEASFGLIYIDGSHIFENVFIDMFYSTLLLQPEGLLLFDDSTDRHVNKVLRFIQTNFRGILKREQVPTDKTLKQRIGHALGIQQLTAWRKVADLPRAWDAPFVDF